MGVITTVRGDIAPSELGFTSAHEHLNFDNTLMASVVKRYTGATIPASMLELRVDNLAFLRDSGGAISPDCATAGDVEHNAAELTYFTQAGGSAVCDATPIGLRGDVRALREASERSGVHVVCSTGLYVADTRPAEWDGASEEAQYTHFLSEVTEGIDGTDIRAGMLKCALSTTDPSGPLNEVELATLRALGRVAVATGLSLHVHTAFPMSSAQVLAGVDAALATGIDPDRLVMIHMDSFLRPWSALDEYVAGIDTPRTASTELARAVLAKGVNIGFDAWGATVSLLPDDHDRLKGLADLLRAGYGDRIVLGHDVFSKAHGKTWGYYGLTRFPQFVSAGLAKLGFEDDAFRRLVVDNPARILAH
ncbi:phosphotriesterase family protein [Demequina soli]|uniref:phosphotriesterase family protein n=1 Tax=Demequina soli TaxID=1638987 RepID=UPI0007861AF4|nr:hypothetical protein [Demequina soli]